ncbi:PREDICTED: acyltransferase-like protein At3g26840, chloroplastic [Camelina sativa]|uniref:Acyltransferase-like protein At3g26840, chloroplastic n=1 Tax=Camelina sativa TaxID=90675 RepID=A0ABM0YWR6_CAMSA|nr:PREDICTED: acyltransferase-like protein At3g26840, chloroplastic [Camelina sativa]
METTTVLRSTLGLCSVSSSSNLRQYRTSAAKHRLTSVKSVTSTTPPPPRGVQRKRKSNDVNGAKVGKVVENPYSKVEAARPDLRKSLSDFLEEARGFVGDGGGPPRWFSPLESGAQAPGSPLLLFLPGIDGTGLGLIRHHKKLGEFFDIWCLHIPVSDRTPAKDLVKLIEKTVKSEYYRFPNRPIYLVGESIGACLALDVAARNPNIDLSLILVNPATHVNNFISQPLSGMLNVLPDGIPKLLEDIIGVKQDGMNPFAIQNTKYSVWPVLLVNYNMHPNLCMKAENIMLTMLIPGPTAPSNNIDVYLAHLIDDLKDLWNECFEVYDSYLKEHFTLRALLLWTISDYPALGTLSGCKVKGKQACNVCGKGTPARWLKFSRKYVYMGNRRRLRPGHPYRRRKGWFDNTVEEGTANRIQTGHENFETLKDFRNDFGRPLDKETKRKRKMLADEEISEEECEETYDQWRWKRRSILFDLPY